MSEISLDISQIKNFIKKFYIILIISFLFNSFLIILIYNSNLMKEINYTSVISNVSIDKDNLSEFEFSNKLQSYTPTCGAGDFFPLIYDIGTYNTLESISEFIKVIDIKLTTDNLYSAKTHNENYFINIVNSQSDQFTFIPVRDKYALSNYPDSQLKFYYDQNLSSLDENYIISFLMDFRSDEVSRDIAIEIKNIIVLYFKNMFDEIYDQMFTNNKYVLEVASYTTANYIKEIENSKGFENDSRLVNCLIKNKFNLRQINLLQSSFKNKDSHKLRFDSDIEFFDYSTKPSIEENLGIYIIPIIFFFLTFLFCLYRFTFIKD